MVPFVSVEPRGWKYPGAAHAAFACMGPVPCVWEGLSPPRALGEHERGRWGSQPNSLSIVCTCQSRESLLTGPWASFAGHSRAQSIPAAVREEKLLSCDAAEMLLICHLGDAHRGVQVAGRKGAPGPALLKALLPPPTKSFPREIFCHLKSKECDLLSGVGLRVRT